MVFIRTEQGLNQVFTRTKHRTKPGVVHIFSLLVHTCFLIFTLLFPKHKQIRLKPCTIHYLNVFYEFSSLSSAKVSNSLHNFVFFWVYLWFSDPSLPFTVCALSFCLADVVVEVYRHAPLDGKSQKSRGGGAWDRKGAESGLKGLTPGQCWYKISFQTTLCVWANPIWCDFPLLCPKYMV